MSDRPQEARAPRPAAGAMAWPGELPGAARVTFEQALRELEWLHRLEQARLLREACRLARRALCPRALARWRARCRLELALALADGVEPPAALRSMAHADPARWPAGRDLACLSLELDDCRAGRRLWT